MKPIIWLHKPFRPDGYGRVAFTIFSISFDDLWLDAFLEIADERFYEAYTTRRKN